MCTLNSLYHQVAVDKVRADPRGIEDRLCVVQEYYTHYVITDVTLFIDLCVCKRSEGGRERERERERENVIHNYMY